VRTGGVFGNRLAKQKAGVIISGNIGH
jgi:hypothetical protein